LGWRRATTLKKFSAGLCFRGVRRQSMVDEPSG
jgi:hypothetical protein